MALKGDLVSADLSNVFQMLALNRKAGVLTVQDRSNPVARQLGFVPVEGFEIDRVLAQMRGRPESLAARALRAAVEELVSQRIAEKLFLPV